MVRVLRLLVIVLLMLAAGAVLVAAQDEGECEVGGLPASPLSAAGVAAATLEPSPCLDESGTFSVDTFMQRVGGSLLSGAYSNALGEYTLLLKQVVPTVPDALDQVIAGYEAQLAAQPDDLVALIGYSFAQWWISDYEGAVASYDRLLEQMPDSVYAILFRGSSRLYLEDSEGGEADIARALELAPDSADVHFIAADAFTYALWDLPRALEQATLARDLGLVTPRVNAILATAYMDQGDEALATQYFADHIAGATAEFIETEPLAVGGSLTLDFVPGRSYRVPVEATAGETLTLLAASDADGVDTLAVLLGPDGAQVTSNDDYTGLNAGIVRQVEADGVYTLLIGTFEGAGTGEVVLSRE